MSTVTQSTLKKTPDLSELLNLTNARRYAAPGVAALALGAAVAASAGLVQANVRLARMERSNGALSGQLGVVGASLDALEHRTSMSLSDAAGAAAESVVMVGFPDEVTGEFSPFGTAWVIAERDGGPVLATNAHVAEFAVQLGDEDIDVQVRRVSESGIVDWAVEDIRIHDGAVEFEFVNDRPIMRQVGESLVPVSSVGLADVALLTLEDGAELGAPLRLANAAQLRDLRPGTEVAAVGHPLENMLGARDRNPASLALGRLLACTDYAFELADADSRYLLHHDVRLHGGSSGSPLMMLDPITGEAVVIGLHCAGDVVFTEGGRVPAGGAYAQRVDLAREMLDEAWSLPASRIDAWQNQVESLSMTVEQRLAFQRMISEAYLEDETGMPDLTSRTVLSQELEIPALAGETHHQTLSLSVDAGKLYSIVATAGNWADLDLSIRFEGETLAWNTREDGIPWSVIRAPSDGQIEIVITTARTYDRASEAQIEVFLVEGI